MKAIEFNDNKDVFFKAFNPEVVKSVEVVGSVYNNDYCVDLKLIDGSIETKTFKSKEDAITCARYVCDCINK